MGVGSSYILFTRGTSKYTEGSNEKDGELSNRQKTGMALLITSNKTDLKKSFSLLSPVFLLVSPEPISVRFLWTVGHRISFDSDSH